MRMISSSLITRSQMLTPVSLPIKLWLASKCPPRESCSCPKIRTPPPRIQWPIVKKVRADLSFHTREPQPHYFELVSGFGERKIEESDMLYEAAGFNVRGAWSIMFIRRQSVSFTKWRQRCLPFARPWPEAATRPSLNNFHDPAIFSHVVQMWCQSPSFADTEVRLKRGRDCK